MYEKQPSNALFSTLQYITSKAEKDIHHFLFKDMGNVLLLGGTIEAEVLLVCFECSKEPYLCVQSCAICTDPMACFFMNHLKPASKVCNLPSHTRPTFRVYITLFMSSIKTSLKKLTGRHTHIAEENHEQPIEQRSRRWTVMVMSSVKNSIKKTENKSRIPIFGPFF